MGIYYEGAERSIDCVGISGREGRWDELSVLPGAGAGWGFEGFFCGNEVREASAKISAG